MTNGEPPRPEADPLIDEVRWLKREASARCGDDLDRLIEQLREIEKSNADRLVRRERGSKRPPGRVA